MPTAVSVGPLEDLAPGTARKVEVDGRSVALVRIGDEVYAIGGHVQPRQRLPQRGGDPRGRAGDRVLEARQHVLVGHRRAADVARHPARTGLRRPRRDGEIVVVVS
jgi:hypothetical protein